MMVDVAPLLLQMQTQVGAPRSPYITEVNDPLLPPQTREGMLAHFPDSIYDLSPESHLSILLGVLLGDVGVGQLRKKITYAHLSQVLMTSHYYDMDRFFADVLGLKRFLSEGLAFDPATESGTAAEWEAVIAADASYRNRVALFVEGLTWGPTIPGLTMMASAVCGVPVRIYETYVALDAEDTADTPDTTFLTYGDLEAYTYGDLDGKRYSEMEGITTFLGRDTRSEFVIRPQGPLTNEQRYHLIRVMDRLKPANSMMTIDTTGTPVYTRVDPLEAYSPFVHWLCRSTLVISDAEAYQGDYGDVEVGDEVERKISAFSERSGDEWFYNDSILSVTSSAIEEDGTVRDHNYERAYDAGTNTTRSYVAADALASPHEIRSGRLVRDGMVSVGSTS